MIKFPVRYDRDDESLEDAEHIVFAHPFVGPGISQEDKHEIGEMIARAMNAFFQNGSIGRPVTLPKADIKSDVAKTVNPFSIPDFIRSMLSDRHKKMLDRKERSLKKFVQKVTAKYSDPKEAA